LITVPPTNRHPFTNATGDTVWDAYLKRRAEKRRLRKLQGRSGGSSSDSDSGREDPAAAAVAGGGGADDPFDDPFFKVGFVYVAC
jgi:hypothetical protein